MSELDQKPAPPMPPPETPVDAGSQALSEALASSFGIIKVVMVLLVLIFLGSGIFIVGPEERAIKLRMGRAVGQGESALLGPGLHFSFPYPIESYEKVSVAGIKRTVSTVGWYATTPEQELAGTEPPVMPNGPINPAVDGYLLTADNNIIHSRATVTYHVADPIRYVFSFVNASNAVQLAVNNALLWAGARFNVDDILTRDLAGFKETVQRRVLQLVKEQDLGIVVDECVVQSRAPRQIKDAFDNVLKAEVVRNKVLDEARSYENQVLSKASADAASRVNTAESDRARLVNDITSQAERFKDLLPKYKANPKLFVEQRRMEVVGRAFNSVQDKIYIAPGAPGQPKEVRLMLNREAPKKQTGTEPGKP